MSFDLSRKDILATEGVWVQYDPDVAFKIRYLMPGKMDEIRAQCTRKQFRRGQAVDEVDQKKLNQLLANHLIEDWKGVNWNGSVAPCSPENKARLLEMSIEISNFIFDVAGSISHFEAEKKETEEKNSVSSSALQ